MKETLKNRFFTIWKIFALIAFVLFISQSTLADRNSVSSEIDMSGEGTLDNPYRIQDLEDLQSINRNLSANYELVSDIDASRTKEWNGGKGFNPIGDCVDTACYNPPNNGFKVVFDGNNYSIKHLYVNRPEAIAVGVFGLLYEPGKIKNVSVENVTISNGDDAGGLVGFINGASVQDSRVTGSILVNESDIGGITGFMQGGIVKGSFSDVSVAGRGDIGGITGFNNGGEIIGSHSTGQVSSYSYSAGGLVGKNSGGLISNSSSSANVNGVLCDGGLVGKNFQEATIRRSYSTGEVNGEDCAGGLAGQNKNSFIELSYSLSDVDGRNGVGGLIGENQGQNIKVTRSFTTGKVTGKNGVGGLIGYNLGSNVSNTYSISKVSGNKGIGGLIGMNKRRGSFISGSYSAGSVQGNTTIGGLVGLNLGEEINGSYWDVEASKLSNSDGGTGLRTEEMIGENAKANMESFNFSTTWIAHQASYPGLKGIEAVQNFSIRGTKTSTESMFSGRMIVLMVLFLSLSISGILYKSKY